MSQIPVNNTNVARPVSTRTAKGAPQRAPMPDQRRAFADALTRYGGNGGTGGKMLGKDRRKEADEGVFAALTAREFAAVPVARTPDSAGLVDAEAQAHLDRIAAAIAEFAKGAEPEVHLSLPSDSYKVEGAILGRDASGQINVTLLPGNAVPPAVAAQWTEQLNERLLRREQRVGRVEVQTQLNRRTTSKT